MTKPKERSKSWQEKVEIIQHSYARVKDHPTFASQFYDNLFFLSPKIKRYFKDTKFEHQHKALMFGLDYLIGYVDEKTRPKVKTQVLRISRTHSYRNLNIHPRDYYYWIEALIMTIRENDEHWYDDLQYYWREVIFLPVSFIMSQYFSDDD